MRVSPFVLAIAGVSLWVCSACVSIPVFAQNFGDVTVKKNPDGSIETYDSSEAPSFPSRRQSHSTYKRSTHKYNDGVVVRKNADGSIETFDSGDGSPAPRRSSAGRSSSHRSDSGEVGTHQGSRSSSGVHKFVHKYPKGVTIKKNPDGTIEVIGEKPDKVIDLKADWSHTGGASHSKTKEKSQSSGKAVASAKTGSAAKSSSVKSSAPKAKKRTAGRQRGRGNYGDVKVIRNPDGSIETYDAN